MAANGYLAPMPELLFDDIWRFWSKVDQGKDEDCWNWNGLFNRAHRNARPCFKVAGKNYYAARIAWSIHHGKDPGDKIICHTCQNPLCMNPAHLYAGTHQDNVLDKFADGYSQSGSLNANSKLNDSDIFEIRESNKSQLELSRIHNVSRSHISRIQRYECW